MVLRVGIAGYGRRGVSHAVALSQSVPDAVVAAVSDPSEAARGRAKLEYPDAAKFAAAEEMANDGGVDAIVVAAPAHLNGVVAREVLPSGRPVLLEKPPAMSSQELQELIELADASGSRVMVAFNRRFNGLIRAAVDAVRDAGPVIQIVAEFHKDIREFTEDPRFAPEIMDWMLMESPIHAVDLVTAIADSPVATVASVAKRVVSPYRDVHAALIEFENGVVCQFGAAYTAGGRLERYEIHGRYVSAYLEGVDRGWLVRGNETKDLSTGYTRGSDLIAQDSEFVGAVLAGRPFSDNAATLESSRDTIRLCERILDGGRR